MFEAAETISVVLFLLQIVGTGIYLIQIGRLLNRLRLSHTLVWETLGSPSLVLNNNFRNNRLVLGWLWGKKYSDLGDLETVRLATMVRTLLVVLLVNFPVLIIVIAVASSSVHWQAA